MLQNLLVVDFSDSMHAFPELNPAGVDALQRSILRDGTKSDRAPGMGREGSTFTGHGRRAWFLKLQHPLYLFFNQLLIGPPKRAFSG